MRSLSVRAPTRLDFGGGWTDVPPYATREGGRVCNVAIARYAEVELSHRPPNERSGDPIRIDADSALVHAALVRAGVFDARSTIRSDFPTGAGLGGSSAVCVALTAALHLWKGGSLDDRTTLIEASRATEVDGAHIAGGWQDHFAAALGGALDISFGVAHAVRRLAIPRATFAALERRCLVYYTGQSRVSGDTITAVMDAWRNGQGPVGAALERLKALAGDMSESLEAGDLDALGEAIGEHWMYQRQLHASIPTALIDELLERARRAGALGGKALGASGGGCIAVMARDGAEHDVQQALDPYARRIEFRVCPFGVHPRPIPTDA